MFSKRCVFLLAEFIAALRAVEKRAAHLTLHTMYVPPKALAGEDPLCASRHALCRAACGLPESKGNLMARQVEEWRAL